MCRGIYRAEGMNRPKRSTLDPRVNFWLLKCQHHKTYHVTGRRYAGEPPAYITNVIIDPGLLAPAQSSAERIVIGVFAGLMPLFDKTALLLLALLVQKEEQCLEGRIRGHTHEGRVSMIRPTSRIRHLV